MMWRFAILVPAVILAPACKKARPASGIRLVYSIDLDAAVDRDTTELDQRLAATARDQGLAVNVRLSIDDAISIVPDDRARLGDVEALVAREPTEKITCASPGPAVCVKLSAAGVAAARKTALEHAVDTIRRRLDRLPFDNAAVTAHGEQIEVELAGGTLEQLTTAKDVISRTGRLELLVVDDCATATPAGCTRDGEHTGSPVMQELYRRASADPAAKQAGIRGEVETWRTPTGARHTDYYLTAPDRAALDRYLTGAPDDHRFVLEHVGDPKSPHWRSYYVERSVRLGSTDIADASARHAASVQLELTGRGRQVFADLTKRIAGLKLALVLDGNVASAPIINAPITGGLIELTTTARDRDELVTTLAAGALPAPVRLETEARFGPQAEP